MGIVRNQSIKNSISFYIGMDIGTAKPTRDQQRKVPHYLLDLRFPDQPITLQEFIW